jgi:hypothetical protein
MLSKRRKHEKLPDYAVRFLGYSARIIARKGNAEYASRDPQKPLKLLKVLRTLPFDFDH